MPVEQILSAAQEASFSDVAKTFFEILEYPAITLLTAMLLEIILPIKASWRLSNLAPLFTAMARKVNRDENSATQTVFSSILLPFFILIVALFCVLFLRFVVNYDMLLSLLILPLLLESKPVLLTTLRVKHALEDSDKEKAREELKKRMLRECSMLSPMGICKALCENVTMSMFANWFAILVWYMLMGLEGAVIMQLVAVMNRAFSCKMEEYRIFGSFVHKFEQIMLIPPAIILLIIMMFSLSFSRILRNLKAHLKDFVNFSSCLAMDLLGSYADTAMGGPRYYRSTLLRLPKLGGLKDPEIGTPLKIYNKIRFCGILFVCICVIIRIFLYTGS